MNPSNINWHRRIRIFSISVVAVFAALFVFLRVTSVHGVDRFGNSLAPDLAQFYVAGSMITHGEGNLIYDDPVFFARVNALLGGRAQDGGYPFLYPPFVAWMSAPLSWVSYSAAATFYLCLNIALAVGLAWSLSRRLVSDSPWAYDAGWIFLASLPVIRCVLYGQNGVISLAVLWFSYLLWKERRHLLCGAVLALGAYKPQLFFGAWFWLALFGTWRARAGLILVGAIWLGIGSAGGWSANPWGAWFHTVIHTQDSTMLTLQKHSIWNAFDLAGPCPEWLLGARSVCWGTVAIAWIGMLLWMRSNKTGGPERIALAWTLAVWGWVWLTPRLVQYDLVMLYPPCLMAWSATTHLPNAARKWQRIFLGAWVTSFYVSDFFARAGIPLVTALGVAIFFSLCVTVKRRLARVP